jgi:hypothetical protein
VGTHGTILVKDGDYEVMLNATHDGHADEALKMILELTERVANNVWVADLMIRDCQRQGNAYDRDDVREDLHQNAGGGFEWSILEVAGAIASTHFNRWRIVPPEFQTWLAEHDRTPDIVFDITRNYDVKIRLPSARDCGYRHKDWLVVINQFNSKLPPNLDGIDILFKSA